MGKDNNNSSSNNKKAMPQTPKTMKTTPGKAREEFSREFTDLINKNVNGKNTNERNKNNNNK